jgi:hypothetical protein
MSDLGNADASLLRTLARASSLADELHHSTVSSVHVLYAATQEDAGVLAWLVAGGVSPSCFLAALGQPRASASESATGIPFDAILQEVLDRLDRGTVMPGDTVSAAMVAAELLRSDPALVAVVKGCAGDVRRLLDAVPKRAARGAATPPGGVVVVSSSARPSGEMRTGKR